MNARDSIDIRRRPAAIAALACALVLALSSGAAAQDDWQAGLFCEARQLPLVSQSVHARILGGEAVLVLVQVFANDGEQEAQADYRLHLPEGATVSGFGFWRGERFLAAELKEKHEAQQAHSAAAASGRATGLLQREGSIHSFSVYPVAAHSLQQVETTLRLPVVRESGRSQLRLPLDLLLSAGTIPSTATIELETEEPLADFGVDGAGAKTLARGARAARMTVSSSGPVDVWWAEEAPPLLTRAEAVDLGDGTLGLQLRVAFNDAGAWRPSFDELVLLIDSSYSMRRRVGAVRDFLQRVAERSPRPVRALSVAERPLPVELGNPGETAAALFAADGGFRSSWEEMALTAAEQGCTQPRVRCVALTDPQLDGLPTAEESAVYGVELLLLADADELAFFGDGPAREHPAYQPGVEPLGALLSRVDEIVLPVLEVVEVEQRGGTLELLAPQDRRVAEGGLLRLVGLTRSTQPLEVRLAVRGTAEGGEVVRTVEPEVLFADALAGRAVRRGVYSALLSGWMREYRLHRDAELRTRIVDVSLREGIPTELTALHVADPGSGFLPAGGTASGLLRRVGILLLLLGLMTLGIYRWTR